MSNTVPETMEVTPEVQRRTANWWKDQVAALEKEGGFTPQDLQMVHLIGCNPENIGYDGGGQIRPGELGQWDVFFRLQQGGWSEQEATRMAGLSGPQVRKMHRDADLQDHGVDPDDPEDVAQFEKIQRMGPNELEAEVTRLEGLLAATEK